MSDLTTQELLKLLKQHLGDPGNFRTIHENEDIRHVELSSEYLLDDTVLSTLQARFCSTEDVDLVRTETTFEPTVQPVQTTQLLNISHSEMTKLVVAWLEWNWQELEEEEEE
jgi:hypothetical protein